MPYFRSSEEWQRQSALLLKARPTTTRITTKYHIPSTTSTTSNPPASTSTPETPSDPKTPIAYLELKTYDPTSGTTLKYKTLKAAEVGRLIAAMGTLARDMASLPELKEDVAMIDAGNEGTETPVEAVVQQTPAAQSTAGKKKKKGKK